MKNSAENSEITASNSARPLPGRPFVAGQSGNPGGRPKVLRQLRELARGHTERAIGVLVECLDDPDPRVRLVAANTLLDRGWGKAQIGVDEVENDAPQDPPGWDTSTLTQEERCQLAYLVLKVTK